MPPFNTLNVPDEITPMLFVDNAPALRELNIVVPEEIKPPALMVNPPPFMVRAVPESGVLMFTLPALLMTMRCVSVGDA